MGEESKMLAQLTAVELEYTEALTDTSDEYDYDNQGFRKQTRSTITTDSEQSYKVLFTRYQVLEFITFLSFNIKWMFLVAISNFMVFFMMTFAEIFDPSVKRRPLRVYMICICFLIFLVDIISTILHYSSSFINKKCFKRKDLPFIVLDILSFLILILEMVPVVGDQILMRCVGVIFLVYRMHEVVEYFMVVSKVASKNTVGDMAMKYGIFFVLIVHVLTLLWYHIGCHVPECKVNDLSWTKYLKGTNIMDLNSKNDWYIMSAFVMMSAFTSTGLGIPHGYSNLEALILTIIALIGLSLTNGIFLGACTSVQMETYRRHSEYSDKIKLIQTKLHVKRLTKSLRKKIMHYYITCWIQLGGVTHSNHFQHLPASISMQITYDKYCNAINSCHLFRHTHDSIKRAISTIMETEIFIKGEVIFLQGVLNNRMIYLARGSVQLLSGTDEESPIMTLEMGTCIGEINIILSMKSPVKVIASSYCVIHSLPKNKLWPLLKTYRKLKQSKVFHKIFNAKLEFARNKERQKQEHLNTTGNTVKTLKIMKSKLVNKQGNYREDGTIIESISDIYKVNKQTTALRHTDEICLKTSFPWILQADSSLIIIWDTMIVILALIVGLVYPYIIGFKKKFDFYVEVFSYIVDISFLSDVILQIFTAVETDTGVQKTVSDIFAIKIRSFAFMIDVVSILPIHGLLTFFDIHYAERIYVGSQFNRICKLYKLFGYLSRLENSFKINVGIIRGVKYVICYVFISYFFGSILYMESCFWETCVGWYKDLMELDKVTNSKRSKSPFYVSLSFVMLIVSQTGFGRIQVTNKLEMISMMCTYVCGVLTFTYLVADYSATLTLANGAFNRFSQMVQVIRKFMENNHMPESLRNRTNEYLASQWRYSNGLVSEDCLSEAPNYIFEEQRAAKYAYLFEKCPLFKGMDAPFLTMLASKSILELLPPNEIVKYAGETTRQMYVIESGYCVVISAISGKEEKILGPGSYIYDFEMVLQQPGIFNIKTLTHVLFLRFNYTMLMHVFKFYPDFKEDLRKITEDVKGSLAIQRIFVSSREVAYHQLIEEESQSWFIFPKRKLHARNIDFLKVFANMGIWKVSKLLLMRRTLMPFGNFILIWELVRGVLVFIATMLYPSVLIQQAYLAYFRYYMLILDLLGIADIYIRLHVCYYDKKGVLVTHPKLTSIYYLSHSFIIDLLALVPIDLLLQCVYNIDRKAHYDSMATYLRIEAIMRFHKLFALYRFPCAFYYFRKDIFKPVTLTQSTIKYVVYSLVLFNVAAIILILTSCRVLITDDHLITLIPEKLSWITYQNADYSFNLNKPINLYVTAIYFMSGYALSVSFGDLNPSTDAETTLVIILLVIGYLFFTYVFVIISNSRANLDLNLTLYQQRMTHLIKYMKEEDIDKQLQRKAISHFEYNWQKTHGMKASVILRKCHTALREDCVLYLYERTLCEVQIFTEQNQSFYRYLGMHLEEAYFLRDFPIIRLNDIVNTVFIIHKGAVSVLGPDGTLFETLERGSVFGNIDDVRHTRSMVTVVASKAVDLLCIKTEKFYSIIREYPAIKHKLQRCLLLENLCYITTKQQRRLRHIINRDKYNEKLQKVKQEISCLKTIKNFLCSKQIDMHMMICSYISLLVVTLHAAFQYHTVWTFFLTYLLDIAHFIKFVAGFYTPYSDSMGEIITEHIWIRDRYVHSLQFYIELFGLLPTELLCFISPDSRLYYLSVLRLNRLFRVWNVFHFFNKTKDYLNVNIIMVRLSKIFLFLTAVLHILSSVLYMVACPKAICNPNNWLVDPNGNQKCNNHYLCSFYYVTSVVTFSAYGDLSPRSIIDLISISIIIMGSKFLVASFAGDMSAMVNSVSSALVDYDYDLKKFNIYLKKHNVSGEIIKKSMQYSHQLWITNKGVQMPVILNEAPNYIIEELMGAAYGKHLRENYVFSSCHIDFLRLLTAKLQLFTFYNGDVICHQGEVNDRMYFIHKGIVEVYAISQTEEIQVDILRGLDCFGMIQGLFKDTPHTHTYISASVTVILSLLIDDWRHLLTFYPAARYDIYQKIQEI